MPRAGGFSSRVNANAAQKSETGSTEVEAPSAETEVRSAVRSAAGASGVTSSRPRVGGFSKMEATSRKKPPESESNLSRPGAFSNTAQDSRLRRTGQVSEGVASASEKSGLKLNSDTNYTHDPSTFMWKTNSSHASDHTKSDTSRRQKGPKFTMNQRPTNVDQAISDICSRTQHGMREGLVQLGLPGFPLNFVPGETLHLCGHDVRDIFNEMIHCHMLDDDEGFYRLLTQIKKIVSNPMLTEDEVRMFPDKSVRWRRFEGSDGQSLYRPLTPGEPLTEEDAEVLGVPSEASQSPPVDEVLDYYETLGVDSAASLAEIRNNFRVLVIQGHPDRGGDPTKFHKLNEAYGILSDKGRRREYDKLLATAGH